MRKTIQWHREDKVVVVSVEGLQLLHEDSRETFRRIMQDNPDCDMVLSCENIGYVSSSALGAIIFLSRDLQRAGRRLILASVEPMMLEVLQMTRMDQCLTIVPDLDTALGLLAGTVSPITEKES